jgi:uncharacterized membrane protein YeaQ/YmgE (transglycosylase-associated protein family)
MMHYIWLVIIGFVIGLVARAVKPGNDKMGIIFTSILGIGGTLLANFVGHKMGWYAYGSVTNFIASVLGAIVLLLIYGMIKKK